MKIDEAIKVIDAVCSQYSGTRKEHIVLQEAVDTIREAFKEQIREDLIVEEKREGGNLEAVK